MRSKEKKPWPTKAVMQQIYENNFWGDNGDAFYSGEGSHENYIIEPYLNKVKSFLLSFPNPISVVDLGCGDFNIGKSLVAFAKKYTAVDIVPELINYNRNNFKFDNLEFQCLDIAKDDLPSGECAIIRQVLQHLSNTEILQIVDKLKQYKYLILTEHLPCKEFVPNKDIISGQGIRLKKESGVDLLTKPFHLPIKSKQEILRIEFDNNKGSIETNLYEL